MCRLKMRNCWHPLREWVGVKDYSAHSKVCTMFFCACVRFSAFVSLQLVFIAHIMLTAPRTNILCISKFFRLFLLFLCLRWFLSVFMCLCTFYSFVSLQLVQLHIFLPAVFSAHCTFFLLHTFSAYSKVSAISSSHVHIHMRLCTLFCVRSLQLRIHTFFCLFHIFCAH